jgi:hypothetical protein
MQPLEATWWSPRMTAADSSHMDVYVAAAMMMCGLHAGFRV